MSESLWCAELRQNPTDVRGDRSQGACRGCLRCRSPYGVGNSDKAQVGLSEMSEFSARLTPTSQTTGIFHHFRRSMTYSSTLRASRER
jgi:hypothetical protein